MSKSYRLVLLVEDASLANEKDEATTLYEEKDVPHQWRPRELRSVRAWLEEGWKIASVTSWGGSKNGLVLMIERTV